MRYLPKRNLSWIASILCSCLHIANIVHYTSSVYIQTFAEKNNNARYIGTEQQKLPLQPAASQVK